MSHSAKWAVRPAARLGARRVMLPAVCAQAPPKPHKCCQPRSQSRRRHTSSDDVDSAGEMDLDERADISGLGGSGEQVLIHQALIAFGSLLVWNERSSTMASPRQVQHTTGGVDRLTALLILGLVVTGIAMPAVLIALAGDNVLVLAVSTASIACGSVALFVTISVVLVSRRAIAQPALSEDDGAQRTRLILETVESCRKGKLPMAPAPVGLCVKFKEDIAINVNFAKSGNVAQSQVVEPLFSFLFTA